MKKVLVVGYVHYETMSRLREIYYNNVLFIESSGLQLDKTPERIVEAVKMVDSVLFYEWYDKLPYEVAAVMLKKPIESLADYPVEEENANEPVSN